MKLLSIFSWLCHIVPPPRDKASARLLVLTAETKGVASHVQAKAINQ